MVTRALVLAGGSGPRRSELDDAWPGWDESIDVLIAADAGALLAEPLGLRLDLIVGDGDSLGEAALAGFEAPGRRRRTLAGRQGLSDTELALIAAAGRAADEVTVLGAFGGRLDHALANIWILAHPALAGRTVSLLDGRSRVRLLSASGPSGSAEAAGLDLVGRPGDLVTLLPFDGAATGVTTSGLRWPLVEASLPAGFSRGLSNEILPADGQPPRVELGGGQLIVIESTLLGSNS